MILIQSGDNDLSTVDVQDWIYYLNTDSSILRINDNTQIDTLTFCISNGQPAKFKIKSQNREINSQCIESFWYRRGRFKYNSPFNDLSSKNNINLLGNALNTNFQREYSYIIESIYHVLKQKTYLNSFKDNFANKILNLSIAGDIGINIPDSIITNEFEEIADFLTKHKKIISKDVEFNTIAYPFDNDFEIRLTMPTRVITSSENLEIPQLGRFDHFAFYQEYIEKKYELRVFYVNDVFYPMAIFSQGNEKTKYDLRNYDRIRPNRCIPYKLPIGIENKLRLFMTEINLTSGSIDMIVTNDMDYVFLEINPIGVFQWLSKYCNYDLERQIAMKLINEIQ